MKKRLLAIYDKLYDAFGPQKWWPADSAFEVMVGAILTQNTSWKNVEKAIANLKEQHVLSAQKLLCMDKRRLARLIRPAGYYNIKAERLKEFIRFLSAEFRADIKKMSTCRSGALRRRLLEVSGIGPETADSMLLYALNKPVFVVDAYTLRIMSRHGLIDAEAKYDELQNLFRKNLKNSVKLFNEYHALLVKLGKDYCLKSKPRCNICPLR